MPPDRLGQFTKLVSIKSRLHKALKRVLLDDAASGAGIVVPQLIALITEYAYLPIQALTLAGTYDAGHRNAFGFDPALTQFNQPAGVSIASDGSLLIADTQNSVIRHRNAETGAVTTLAGEASVHGNKNGTLLAARFHLPVDVCHCPDGSLLLSEAGANSIRRISNGVVSLVAGSLSGFKDGTGPHARFSQPHGLCCTADGAYAYVADCHNHRIRRVRLSDGDVTTCIGNGGELHTPGRALSSSIAFPLVPVLTKRSPLTPEEADALGLDAGAAANACGPDTVMYIACHTRIRCFDFVAHKLSTVETDVRLRPIGLAVVKPDLLIASCARTHALYSVDVTSGRCVRLGGTGKESSKSTHHTPAGMQSFSRPKGLRLTTHASGDVAILLCDGNRIRTLTVAFGRMFSWPVSDKNAFSQHKRSAAGTQQDRPSQYIATHSTAAPPDQTVSVSQTSLLLSELYRLSLSNAAGSGASKSAKKAVPVPAPVSAAALAAGLKPNASAAAAAASATRLAAALNASSSSGSSAAAARVPKRPLQDAESSAAAAAQPARGRIGSGSAASAATGGDDSGSASDSKGSAAPAASAGGESDGDSDTTSSQQKPKKLKSAAAATPPSNRKPPNAGGSAKKK